ncbi:MAG: hypothetical protein ABUL73_00985 [Alphaproteobacteria bacterium]
MSDSLASTFRLRGPPATLEARALFRVHTAALHAAPSPTLMNAEVVVMTRPDGRVVAYPPSPKLAILAVERERRAALKAPPTFTF